MDVESLLLLDSGAYGFCRSCECYTSTDKVERGACLAQSSTYIDRQVLLVILLIVHQECHLTSTHLTQANLDDL